MPLLEFSNAPPTSRTVWKSLEAHHKKVKSLHLRDLFAQDSSRGERYTAHTAGLLLDYSKNRITDTTLAAYRALLTHPEVAPAEIGHPSECLPIGGAPILRLLCNGVVTR